MLRLVQIGPVSDSGSSLKTSLPSLLTFACENSLNVISFREGSILNNVILSAAFPMCCNAILNSYQTLKSPLNSPSDKIIHFYVF